MQERTASHLASALQTSTFSLERPRIGNSAQNKSEIDFVSLSRRERPVNSVQVFFGFPAIISPTAQEPCRHQDAQIGNA